MPRRVKPKPLVSEADVESAGNVVLEAEGWQSWKLNGLGRAGRPDRLIWRGWHMHAFIEYKRPGEFPTELQQEELDALEAAGHWVAVCDAVRQVSAFITSIIARGTWHGKPWRERWKLDHAVVKRQVVKKAKKGGRRGA